MENENEQAQDVQEQEDTSAVEVESDTDFGQDEETVTIAKSKFNAIRRKASAYDATKDKPQKINNSSDAKKFERLELRVEGYQDEEIDFLLKNGGKKALENGFIKSAIEGMRQQKIAESAVLASEGQKSSQKGGLDPSSFSKLSADEQLKALSSLS